MEIEKNEFNSTYRDEIARLHEQLEREREKSNRLGAELDKYRASEEGAGQWPLLMADIVKLANLGTWEYTPSDKVITVSAEWLSICGLMADEFDGTFEQILSLIHPHDLEAFKQQIEQAFATKMNPPSNLRIVRPDGKTRYLGSQIQMVVDKNGEIERMYGFVVDITERKMRERALKESKSLYQSLVNSLPINIYRIDRQGRLTFVNQAFANLMGISAEGLVGKIIYNLYPEELAQKYREDDARILEEGDTLFLTEKNIDAATQEKIFVEVIKIPFRNDINEIEGIQGVFWDITDRKRNEEAMKTSHWVFNHLVDMLCLVSFEGYLKVLNPIWEETLGWTAEELMAKPFIEFVHPDDRYKTRKAYSLLGEERGLHQFENRYLCKDGSFRWLSWYAYPYFEENILFAVARDITEKVKIEMELHTTQLHYIDFINYSSDLISYWTPPEDFHTQLPVEHQLSLLLHSAYKDCNNKFLESCGYLSKDSLLGKTIGDVLDRELYNHILIRFIEGNYKLSNYEVCEKGKGGDDFYGLLNLFGIVKNGKLSSIWYSMKDISGQKQAEARLRIQNQAYESLNEELSQTNEELRQMNDELTKAKLRAEESDRLKTAFLQNMSHEVRTPMNGIIGFSEMLKLPDIKEEKKSYYVKIIIDSCYQLLSIVEDILDISRLETGQVKLQAEEVQVNNLVLELFSFYSPRAADNGIMLFTQNGLTDSESAVRTDRGKIRRILSNMIDNSLKFTQSGHVKFGYRLVKIPNAYLEFFVEDTGIGIPPEKHEEIFERFTQADMRLSKNYGGTGLGLAICKGMVELLGGKIWLKSEEKRGTTFYFTIPYYPVNESFLQDRLNEGKADKKVGDAILVAEDESINFLFTKEIIEEIVDKEIDILHAKNGLEAIELCKTHFGIRLVLMDIKMPQMNGYEASKEIKKIHPNLPIIAQTAYAMSENKKKAVKSGCDDYIAKPVKPYELKLMIEKYLQPLLY